MKNKKMVFGTILFLFILTGICNIQNVSAITDTVNIPPLSYAWYYMGHLEDGDAILINEIDSDGIVDVYIMNGLHFEALQDSGGLIWNFLRRWQDIQWMAGWSIEITEDEYYYIVISNEAILTEKTVYVNIGVQRYSSGSSENIFWNLLFYVIIPIVGIILVIAIPIILVRRHKRKSPKE